MKRNFIAAVLLAGLLACGGCGGNHKPSPSPSPTPHTVAAVPSMSFSKVHGMHIHAAKTTTTTTTSIVWDSIFSLPKVEAATIVAVDQNWEGDCQSSPVSTGDVATITLFGVGQTVDETCSHSWVDNDADGSVTAGFNTTGKIVYGDGTLSNLVVSVEHGTSIQSSVHIAVWVKRAGVVVPTGISCDLAPGNDEQICQSTAKFAVQHLDRVLATISRHDGDSLVNLNAAFTKSIP